MSDNATMRRVLLVKLGAIGDALMLLPTAKALHDAGSAVEWLCGRQIAPLLALYPWITTIVADETALLRGDLLTRGREVARLWRLLAGRRYDLIATMYYDTRYRLLSWTARSARRLSLSTKDRSRRILPGRSYASEYARIVLGLEDVARPTHWTPTAPERLPRSPLVENKRAATIVLVPGGARNLVREDALRRWPVENFVAVARELLAAGYEVVLSGGPDDRWAAAAFAGMAVTDLIGRCSLVETLGLFAAAAVVVTPDTGPLHLAGITGAGLVAIFGPTSPYAFLPWRPGVVALWGGEDFACRPCYDGRDYAPCPSNACVQAVTPGLVLAEIARSLAERDRGEAAAPRITTVRRSAMVQEITQAEGSRA